VGYVKTEITVGSASFINVVLTADNTLDEVVVVAYGTQKKENITAAVATVKAEELEQVPLSSFEQILQGRLPGVEISSGSGQPGTVARVRVRGQSSISGNNTPLYIVDGIEIDPNSFASLNSNNFESVTVLKDAEATSLYGSRGGAGVIVVTTKKGKFNQKTTISLRTFSGISQAPSLNRDVLDAQQFLEISRLLNFNGAGTLSDADIAAQVEALGNFDPENTLLRTGRTNSYELSANGGGENTSFFTSLSYFEQESTVINSDLQRINTSLNLNHKFNEKFSFEFNNSLGFSRINNVPNNGGVSLANPFLAPFIGNPTEPIFNDDGTFNSGNPTLPRLLPNIFEDLQLGLRETEEFKLISTARFNYNFTDWLKLSYNVGIDFEDDFTVNAFNPITFRGTTVPAIGGQGQQQEISIRDLRFTSTLQLGFDKSFGKHDVGASIFWEVNNREIRASSFTGFGIEPSLFGFSDGITAGTADNGLIPTVANLNVAQSGATIARNSIVSVFGRANYTYDNRFGFSGSLRSDRSSRIAPENSDIIFYSVSARWNLENEKFLENATWIDQLKPRISFGTSGNDAGVPPNAFIQQLGLPLFNGGQQFVLGGLANTNSLWEFTEQFNAGVDFGFWKGTLSGSFDYYRSVTSNLLLNVNLPAIFGDNAVFLNTGSIDSEGVELALNYNIFQNEDWRVSVFGNGAYNFGTVRSLGLSEQIEVATSIVREGEQLGAQFVVEFAGVNPANGQPLYRDLDGNITTEFSDANRRTGFGSSEPLYTGGFGFDAGYKGFSISTLFAFQAEVTRFNNATFFQENFNFLGAGLNQSETILTFFQNAGDITEIPAPFVNGQATQRQFSTQDLEDASFLRLRDITISYSFDRILKNNSVLKNARIYARGVNLLTFTNFTGLDPEDNNNIAQFEFPNPRQYTFGLDLTF